LVLVADLSLFEYLENSTSNSLEVTIKTITYGLAVPS
jgi:hypothetical protein